VGGVWKITLSVNPSFFPFDYTPVEVQIHASLEWLETMDIIESNASKDDEGNEFVRDQLRKSIDGCYYCWHHPELVEIYRSRANASKVVRAFADHLRAGTSPDEHWMKQQYELLTELLVDEEAIAAEDYFASEVNARIERQESSGGSASQTSCS